MQKLDWMKWKAKGFSVSLQTLVYQMNQLLRNLNFSSASRAASSYLLHAADSLCSEGKNGAGLLSQSLNFSITNLSA